MVKCNERVSRNFPCPLVDEQNPANHLGWFIKQPTGIFTIGSNCRILFINMSHSPNDPMILVILFPLSQVLGGTAFVLVALLSPVWKLSSRKNLILDMATLNLFFFFAGGSKCHCQVWVSVVSLPLVTGFCHCGGYTRRTCCHPLSIDWEVEWDCLHVRN